jgi:hypothetical protein
MPHMRSRVAAVNEHSTVQAARSPRPSPLPRGGISRGHEGREVTLSMSRNLLSFLHLLVCELLPASSSAAGIAVPSPQGFGAAGAARELGVEKAMTCALA